MKVCRVCGVEIINGENGCQLMGDICYKCGGQPDYSHCPPRKLYDELTWDEVDHLEAMCLNINGEYEYD